MEMNTLYLVLFVMGFTGLRAILEELPMWMKRYRFRRDIASGKTTYGHVYKKCNSLEMNSTMDCLVWSYKNDRLSKKEGVIVFEGSVDKYIA